MSNKNKNSSMTPPDASVPDFYAGSSLSTQFWVSTNPLQRAGIGLHDLSVLIAGDNQNKFEIGIYDKSGQPKAISVMHPEQNTLDIDIGGGSKLHFKRAGDGTTMQPYTKETSRTINGKIYTAGEDGYVQTTEGPYVLALAQKKETHKKPDHPALKKQAKERDIHDIHDKIKLIQASLVKNGYLEKNNTDGITNIDGMWGEKTSLAFQKFII